jgi:hypothetical protein
VHFFSPIYSITFFKKVATRIKVLPLDKKVILIEVAPKRQTTKQKTLRTRKTSAKKLRKPVN